MVSGRMCPGDRGDVYCLLRPGHPPYQPEVYQGGKETEVGCGKRNFVEKARVV